MSYEINEPAVKLVVDYLKANGYDYLFERDVSDVSIDEGYCENHMQVRVRYDCHYCEKITVSQLSVMAWLYEKINGEDV
jgi:hypothetical protein